MKSNYKRLGDYIKPVREKNTDLKASKLLGINIDKFFMPSVANVVGTDMSNYKIVKKGQFACNRMHVGRDYRIPIALSKEENPFMVSPAYDVFEINNTKVILPEYLMMWFTRKEFDRNCWFHTDADVRGGLPWNAFCDLELPIPSPEKQQEIVREYHTIQNRIALNNQLISKLEETAQAIYKQWFVDFEFPFVTSSGVEMHYKSNGGKMVWCKELEKEIPEGWKVTQLSDLSKLITKGTTPETIFPSFSPELIPFIKIQSISKNNFINPLKVEFITKEIHNQLKRSQIFDGDILFSITGTLGEFAKATKNITPANTNQNIAIIRIDENIISSNFIYWLFMCGWHDEYIVENTQEAVQANLNLSMIGDIRILMPDAYFLNLVLKKINVIMEVLYNTSLEIKFLSEIAELLLGKITKVEHVKEIV